MSMARIEVVGNLGATAETTYTQNGIARCAFSVAHSPRAREGQQQETSWYRCAILGKRAESLGQYLVKGTKVFVRGDFTCRLWTDRNNVQQISLDVLVTEVELLSSKQESQPQQTQQAASGQQSTGESSHWLDEDLPF